MIMRRMVSLLLLCGLTLTAAAGCRSAPDVPPPVMRTVKVAALPGSWEGALLDLLITDFQQQHEGYRIEKVLVAEHQLLEYARTGKADILPLLYTDKLMISHYLQPLDPLLSKSRVDQQPYGGTLDQLRVRGSLYDLPYGLIPSLLVYNTELFREAGVQTDPAGWSWEEFRQAAAKLTDASPQRRVWGFETIHYDLLARAYVEGRAGVPVWEADPEVVGEALRFFAGMVFDDRSMPVDTLQPINRDGSGESSYSRIMLATLNQGQTALTMETGMILGALPAAVRVPWDVAAMPAGPGGRPVAYGRPITFGISHASADLDGAWEFLRFAVGEEGAMILARAGFQPLFDSEGVRKAWAGRPTTIPPGADSIWQTDWVLREATGSPEARALRIFQRAVNQTLSGNMTWEQALADYREELGRALQ